MIAWEIAFCPNDEKKIVALSLLFHFAYFIVTVVGFGVVAGGDSNNGSSLSVVVVVVIVVVVGLVTCGWFFFLLCVHFVSICYSLIGGVVYPREPVHQGKEQS